MHDMSLSEAARESQHILTIVYSLVITMTEVQPISVIEGFDRPQEYDIETLVKMNRFCRFLRTLRWPSQDNIKRATELARDVQNEELASAALKRHIKQFAYNAAEGGQSHEHSETDIDHQRALWYVLDSLVKDASSHFKFFFQDDIVDLIEDSMPYKTASESKKYKMLMDSWIGVFDATYLLKITEFQQKWVSEIEFGATLPQDETVTKAASHRALDYSPPCHEYLQGKCYDNQCPFQHPIGEEGSLPAEAKPGDWQCTFCATINRHFRRRCTFCPTEKTQYCGRGNGEHSNITFRSEASVYPRTVPANDPRFDCLRAQFGYDFMDEEAAKKYWDAYFEMADVNQWIYDRSLFYRMRILKKPPADEEEEEVAGTVHFPDIDQVNAQSDNMVTSAVLTSRLQQQNDDQVDAKNKGLSDPSTVFKQKLNLASESASASTIALPTVPEMAPPSQIAWIHKTLKESGVKGRNFSGYLCQFVIAVKRGVLEEQNFRYIKWLGVIIADVFRAAFHSFIAFKKSFVGSLKNSDAEKENLDDEEWHPLLAAKRLYATFDSFHAQRHPAYPFSSDIRKMLKLLPVSSDAAQEMEQGIKYVLEKSEVVDEDPMDHFEKFTPKIEQPSEGLLRASAM